MISPRATKFFKTAGCLLLLLFFLYYVYRCPIYALIGIPCPGCNMRSAFYALLQGDIRSSLHYHAMLLPTVILLPFLLILHGKKREKLLVFWCILMLGYYVIRICIQGFHGVMAPNESAQLLQLIRQFI